MIKANESNKSLLETNKLIQESQKQMMKNLERNNVRNDEKEMLIHERQSTAESLSSSNSSPDSITSVKFIPSIESLNNNDNNGDYIDLHRNCVSTEELNIFYRENQRLFEEHKANFKIVQKQKQELKENNRRLEQKLMVETVTHVQEIRRIHEQYRNKK